VDFETAKQEYLRLRAAFDAGEITAAQFEEAAYALTLEDAGGRLWQIGLSSGAWYRKEGDAWIEDTPPEGMGVVHKSAPAPIAQEGAAPRAFRTVPAWVWTVLVLSVLVTWLGLISVVAYYYSSRKPAPVAVVRTVVVYGVATATNTPSPFPTPVPPTEPVDVDFTLTPADIEEPFPTVSAEPTLTITPAPTVQGNQLPLTTWRRLSWSNFDRLESVRAEWRQTIDDAKEYELGDYQFVNYKGLNSVLFKYYTELTDIIMEVSEEDLVLSDIEIEEVIAFKPGSEAGYLDIMCRFSDWIFNYTFSVNSRDWALIKYDDDQEFQLANGEMPAGFRNGDWGRVRMRCVGDTISVWVNSKLLVSVRDATFPSGEWAMTLYMNEGFEEAEIYLNSHRVYYDSGGIALVGDMVQAGDTFITLDRGWRREGTRYSLGVWIENRSTQALDISADQVYLLRPDGRRIAVDASPSEGNAFQFPLKLQESLRASDLYFTGLTAEDIGQGLQLVFNLTAAGLNEFRFQLPVE
jgi:hypothetical protein